jgi:hypothetical protein
LIIVMTLLTFIVLGLLAVFNQTQRAFKAGLSQVDVLESGRATMDLITRELEEMTPMAGTGYPAANFVVEIPKDNGGAPLYRDLLQDLPGTNLRRTNILQEFFFVSRVNQEWIGTGYLVNGGADGVGTLYRYSARVSERELPDLLRRDGGLYELYATAPLTNFNRVADGVIHLRLQAYGTNGFLLEPFYDRGVYTNITVDYDPGSAISTFYEFRSNALPTAVEVELAVVEPDVWERAQALPASGTIRRDYLAEQAGAVHVFKQRVPIREADPDAYKP